MKNTIIALSLILLLLVGYNYRQKIQQSVIPENKTQSINKAKEVLKELVGEGNKDQEMAIQDEQESIQKTKEKDFKYFENKDYATDGKNIYINAYDGGSSYFKNYQLVEYIDV
jgi:uncharacterized lipoprotein NlpE involved in copper resistance